MGYIKIYSLWKREGWYFHEKDKKNTSPILQATRQSFIIGDYSHPEFGTIKNWRVDEKIDGTNIRVMWNCYAGGWEGVNDIKFGGRTKDAQIPATLFEYLMDHFTQERMKSAFPDGKNVILFGEGYGPKIQDGGKYRSDVGFILFDVYVNGWWLKREDVKIISEQLEIPMVPDLGIMTESEIVEFVKSKPLSRCSREPQVMEGVVCRSEPLMLFRDGKPVMWKLKVKEF